MFVVVGYVAAWFAECPLVCLTTTVSGTKSLHKKVLSSIIRLEGRGADGISMHCSYSSAATEAQIQYFRHSIRAAELPATSKGKKAPVRIHRDVVAKAGLGGNELAPSRGILFIADTAAQMRRAIKLITEVRTGEVGAGQFGLIIDEADSFQRTEDDTLQLEQRLNDLKGIGVYVCACIRVYVCEYVCMYTCIYVCVCVHVYVYMCVCMCACIRVYMCVYVCMYTCIHVCVCVHVYMYICVCMCTCIRVNMCVYVCMYTCIYVCACIRVYMCVYVCMYTCIYVCVCAHVYVYICVCMYTCVCVCACIRVYMCAYS